MNSVAYQTGKPDSFAQMKCFIEALCPLIVKITAFVEKIRPKPGV
jgi:hypothetical protein